MTQENPLLMKPAGCGSRGLLSLLPLLGFSLSLRLYFRFEMLVDGRPKAFEKVVECADAGQIVRFKAAQNGVDRRSFHLVYPFSDPHGWIGHQEKQIGSKEGCGVSGFRALSRVFIHKQS